MEYSYRHGLQIRASGGETADIKLTKPNCDRLTHAYVHWLADVHSGSFAPAFTSLATARLHRVVFHSTK